MHVHKYLINKYIQTDLKYLHCSQAFHEHLQTIDHVHMVKPLKIKPLQQAQLRT